MGYYINPPDMEKEEFLKLHGRRVSMDDVRSYNFDRDELPVVLVDNGAFTAAGIAYSPAERNVFCAPDRRPRFFFFVKTELLEPYMKD